MLDAPHKCLRVRADTCKLGLGEIKPWVLQIKGLAIKMNTMKVLYGKMN
jgi:hypothetical protein